MGFEADIINGDTSAAAERTDNRQKRIKAFQEAAGFGVIILSPLAVGFGVNIQAANHVIHFTRTWNPAREDQATDRAYRIGQSKDVYVYYPVVVAKDFVTFDAKLDQLLEIKRKLSQDMLNGCGDVGPADFSDLQDVEVQPFSTLSATAGALRSWSRFCIGRPETARIYFYDGVGEHLTCRICGSVSCRSALRNESATATSRSLGALPSKFAQEDVAVNEWAEQKGESYLRV